MQLAKRVAYIQKRRRDVQRFNLLCDLMEIGKFSLQALALGAIFAGFAGGIWFVGQWIQGGIR